MKLFQVRFTDGSYTQLEALSKKEVITLLGIEVVTSIVELEMMSL